MPESVFPLDRPESGDDDRFTLGLTLDVLGVLAAHGYPDATHSPGDVLAMQQVLFRFLYKPRSIPLSTSDTELPGGGYRVSDTTWVGLTPDQADGTACVVCGRNYRRSTFAHVPVGYALATGSQVFACVGRCAELATARPTRTEVSTVADRTGIEPMARLVAMAAVAVVLAGSGCYPGDTTPAPDRHGPAAAAFARLGALQVRAEDTGAHYRRAEWGGWSTQDGCDTREMVLRRQGSGLTTGRGCRITGGTWVSVYDGQTLRDPARVQIDHRVPVKEAVRSGARGWDRVMRERFYTDPTNLVAVSATANAAKGDGDPGRWRPSNRDAWCGYATGYITTKHAYQLWVDQAEHDALVSMLRTCPPWKGHDR